MINKIKGMSTKIPSWAVVLIFLSPIVIFLVIFASQHFEIKKQSQLTYIAPGSNFVINVPYEAKLDEIKSHIKIEPEIKGEFNKDYRQLVFTPAQPVKAGEKYKITYSQIVKSHDGKYKKYDYEFNFEVIEGLSVYTVSYSNRDLYTFNADDKERILSFIGLYDIEKLEVKLFQSDLPDYLSQYTKETKDTSKLKFIQKWELDCANRDSVMVKLPDCKEGMYLIETKTQKEKNFFYYQVTPYAMLGRRAGNRWCVLAVDTKSGNVLPGMNIDCYTFNYSSKGEKSLKKLISGKTDTHGFSYFDKTNSDTPKIIIGELGGKYIINNIIQKEWGGDYEGSDGKRIDYRTYLYTDRPLYKPGDIINFKGIVRIDDDAKYSIPTGQEILLEVQGDWNTPPIYKKLYKCNSEGIFFGSFKLNEELKTGEYSLYAKIGDRNESWTPIQVEKYVKPEFELKLSSNKEKYVQGEKMVFKPSAMYYFGNPVVGQKISYKVFARDISYWDWYGYGGGEEINHGEATLNDKGEAEIAVTAPETKSRKAITVEISLADESGRPSATSKSVMVTSSDLTINIDSSYFWGEPGKEKIIPVRIIDASNKPAKGIDFTAKIFRVNYYYDDGYDSKEQKQELANKKLTTSDDGKASFSFTPHESGSYRVLIEAKDQNNKPANREFHFYVWGRPQKDKNQKTEIILIPDKETYRLGDEARIYATLPIEKGVVMLTLTRGKLYKAWAQKFSDYKTSFVVPVTEEFMPNIFLQADVFAENQFTYAEKKLEVPAVSKKIRLSVIPASHNGSPGKVIDMSIKTSDEKDRPIRANVSLALIDKALFALQSDNATNIFDSFYSERGNSVQLYNTMWNPIGYGAEKGCFLEGTKIAMADGRLANIEDVCVGDSVLTKLSESSNQLCPAKVAKKFKHFVDEYFIINDSLKVTPPHIMYVNGGWKEAWKIRKGDRLLDVNGNSVDVKTIEYKKEPVNVFNLTVDEQHTFFADSIYVHNDKGGDMPPRQNFVDVAYWNPNIQTGFDGTAKVHMKLPDNLTTWVAHSKGVSIDTKVGQGEAEIIVSKPLFIRPLIPRFFRNGDKVEIKAMVHNYSKDVERVAVSMEPGKIKLLTDKIHQVTLNPGEIKTVRWQVLIPQVNTATLTFSAEGKNGNDTVIFKVPVKPFGEKVEFSQAGRAPGKLRFIKDRQSMPQYSSYLLTIGPSVASKFPAMIQALVDYPYGCTEQTMSKLYPTVLVYRYQKELGIKPPKDIKIMLEKGLTRLAGFQHEDGGWGWWVDDKTNLQMTGYVVEGLLNIKKSKLPVNAAMLDRGVQFLKKAVYSEPDANLKAYLLYVLNEDGLADPKLAEDLAKDKNLGVQGKCFVAIVLNSTGLKAEALLMLKSIKQEMEKSQNIYYWKTNQSGADEFMDSTALASSAALKMFVRLMPKDEALPGIVQGLLREDNYHMTRDTAVKLSALTEYLVMSGELSPNYNYSVLLNGRKIAGGSFNRSTLQEKVFNLKNKNIKDNNVVELKKNGEGNMFYSFKQTEYQNVDNIGAKSGKFSLNRTYRRINGAGGTGYNAGEIVKVVLNIESSADINYVIVEDHLPAGLEPVNMRLKNEAKDLENKDYYYDYYGWDEKDLRDDRVVTFVTYLSKGERKISYLLRAVTRGKTRASPAVVQSMYYPEIWARSHSDVIEVK